MRTFLLKAWQYKRQSNTENIQQYGFVKFCEAGWVCVLNVPVQSFAHGLWFAQSSVIITFL